jgi:hypothetical protein
MAQRDPTPSLHSKKATTFRENNDLDEEFESDDQI